MSFLPALYLGAGLGFFLGFLAAAVLSANRAPIGYQPDTSTGPVGLPPREP